MVGTYPGGKCCLTRLLNNSRVTICACFYIETLTLVPCTDSSFLCEATQRSFHVGRGRCSILNPSYIACP